MANSYWQVEIFGLDDDVLYSKQANDFTLVTDWDEIDESEEPFGEVESIKDVVAAILFEKFPGECEGVVLEEETFKEFKRTGKSSCVKAFFSKLPDLDEIKREVSENIAADLDFTLKLTHVEEKDWSEEWKKHWEPSKISNKIVICPTWRTYEPNEDEIVVKLDPGAAFGTGAHATTQLCIQAIEKFMPENAEVADVGCGSGILAICSLKLGAKSAVGVDNDELVIPVAIDNSTLNGVDGAVKFFAGTSKDLLGKTYDFICANILHNVLNEIMGELKQLMKSNGKMVLSGILDEKEHVVLAAIEREGLKLTERLTIGNWVGLVVEK